MIPPPPAMIATEPASTWETIAALATGLITAILWGLIKGTLKPPPRRRRPNHQRRRHR